MDANTAIQVVDLTKFYYIIGALIVTNLGTLAGIAIAAFKTTVRVTRFISKLEHQVEENTKDIDAAHGSIRDLYKLNRELISRNNGTK